MTCRAVRHSMPASISGGVRIGSRLPRSWVPVSSFRCYATQTSLGTSTAPSKPRHKAVTPFSDDGSVKWGELSPAEKVARTTQQSFNFLLIGGGALGTLAVALLLYSDVFSQDSSITQYNHAVDRVRADSRATDILGGKGTEISALGKPTGTSWVRQRPQAILKTDKYGTEHMWMDFRVQGPKREGAVRLHMLRRQDEKHWNFGTLALDVSGQSRIYLENENASVKEKKSPKTFMGFRVSR